MPRPISAKLTRNDIREKAIKSRRKLKGTRMLISEKLTNTNQALPKSAKVHQKVKAAWTVNGKITVLIRYDNNECKQTIIYECDIQNL